MPIVVPSTARAGRRALVLGAAACVGFSSSPLAAQTRVAPAMSRTAGPTGRVATLLAADSALSASAWRSAAALADRDSEDVILLYPGLGVERGTGRVRAVLDSLSGPEPLRLRWRAVRSEVSADGTLGYTLGYGERAAADSLAPVRYMAAWRRVGSGPWHVAAFVLVRGTAAQPSAAPAGCETPGERHAGPLAARRGQPATVVDADRAFAARAASETPGAAFAAWIADDGLMLGGPAGMSCGRAPLAAAFAGSTAGDLLWAPVVGETAGSDDLGFTVGTARARSARGTTGSKYLTIWRRQADGAWRFVADGGNAAPLAP